MGAFVVGIDDPRANDVRALLDAHIAFARTNSVPEDVHALDGAQLVADGVTFFSVREEGDLLGVGALRQLDDLHAEIKSMHTEAGARGRGVGRVMLDHLVEVARTRRCRRVSLETGSTAPFAPARALYASSGFEPCAPFGEYEPSPNRVCMTIELHPETSPTLSSSDRHAE